MGSCCAACLQANLQQSMDGHPLKRAARLYIRSRLYSQPLLCVLKSAVACVAGVCLQENPAGFEAFDHFDQFDHCETIDEEISMPTFAAAQKAAASAADAPAGQDSTDLMAAADEALATAAADSVLTAVESLNTSRQASLEAPSSPASAEFPCARRHSSLAGGTSASAFAAAVPSSLRSGSEESMSLQALQGLQVMPSRRHSVLMSVRSMRSTGLPRASTLKVMESSHAWEELHGT